jgi:flagellar basal body rod protein FlgG
MMDPAMARLRADISERGEEILNLRTPGFEPQHEDVRSTPRIHGSDNPLSVVAPSDARFVVSDREGRHSYSRDGAFALRDGQLVAANGAPVLGYAPGSNVLSTLRIPRQDELLGRIRDVHLERDGSMAYERSSFDPRTGQPHRERVVVGTLALARFPAGSEPVSSGGLERAPIGVQPHVGRPGDGVFGNMTLGFEEYGAVDLNRALARLHDAYQQLDAVAAAQRAARQTVTTAMDLVK